MTYFIKVLKNYAYFEGRATRSEFWSFVLISAIIQLLFLIIDHTYGLTYLNGNQGILTTLYNIAVLLPTIGVNVRRMHDIDRKGWFILIPVYGFFLTFQPGTPGDNRFGPNSLGVSQPQTTPTS